MASVITRLFDYLGSGAWTTEEIEVGGGGSQPIVTAAQTAPTHDADVCASFGLTWDGAVCTEGAAKLNFDFGSGTETTAAIPFDATCTEIIAAIEALPSVAPGECIMPFGMAGLFDDFQPLSTDPFTEIYFLFVGSLIGVDIPTPTVSDDTTDGGVFSGPNQDYPVASLDANSGDVWVNVTTGSGAGDLRSTLDVYTAAIVTNWQVWIKNGTCPAVLYYVPS